MEKLPSKQVIEAVERAPSNQVVASDVAATAGVSLHKARQDLTVLAALARADLAVTSDGELIYRFPNSVSSALAQNSAKYKALQTFRKVWPALFWLVRVSFGVTLVASLVAIFSTIFFIQSSSSSDDDRRRDNRGGFGGGGGGGLNMYFGPSPFDFFYYRPYGYYGYYGNNNNNRAAGPEEMGFLESCFSYIFGDGNPNANIEEKRLSLAANMIRNNKGAVTAEQLAPFVEDAPPTPRDDRDASAYVDESFVLPIVSQLGGEPIVTDDGEIVYVFPELQTSTSSTPNLSILPAATATSREARVLKRAGMSSRASTRDIVQVLNYNGIRTPRGIVEKSELIDLLEEALPAPTPQEEDELLDLDPTVLQEREWRFSLAPDMNKVLAGGLGIVNLGGALWLGNLLAQYAEYGVRLPSYFGTVQAFYPLLLGYAVLFNFIPVARNLWIKAENEKIRQRNKRRKGWQAALEKAVYSNDRIAKKLKAAAKLKLNVKQIGSDKNDIVFDTSESIEEIKSKKERAVLDDFDKLLGKDDNAFQ